MSIVGSENQPIVSHLQGSNFEIKRGNSPVWKNLLQQANTYEYKHSTKYIKTLVVQENISFFFFSTCLLQANSIIV